MNCHQCLLMVTCNSYSFRHVSYFLKTPTMHFPPHGRCLHLLNMKKLSFILFFCFCSAFNLSYAESIELVINSATQYIESCHAFYYLKVTYCKKNISEKTTSCFNHAANLVPPKSKRDFIKEIKMRLLNSTDSVQHALDKEYLESLQNNHDNRMITCEEVSQKHKQERDDKYIEFRKNLKTYFPKNK